MTAILRRDGTASMNGGEAVALFEVRHDATLEEAITLLGGHLIEPDASDPDVCLRAGGFIHGVKLRTTEIET